jgi:hypothetical protein
MFPVLSLCRQRHGDFLVRAAQDRCVDLLVEQADTPTERRSHHQRPRQQHLCEGVRGCSAQGEQGLDLDATKQSRARTAHLAISFGSLRLLPAESPQVRHWPPLVVWVVRVWEPAPPEGVQGLSWGLLTSVPVQRVEQAWERVDGYRTRWIVEDSQQGLKTGCRLEGRHLQRDEGLRRLLGLVAPAAVRLLHLRAVARQRPEQPASQVLPTEVVQVVAAKAGGAAGQLTTQQCWDTSARLGGYLGRKGDGPPSWKTLRGGWLSIQTLLEGVHLAARLSLDSSSDP